MAMVFYEMISGRLPFGKLTNLAHAEGKTPFIDPGWHRGFMEVSTPVATGARSGNIRI